MFPNQSGKTYLILTAGVFVSRMPPNCRFEIDDLEKEWTWNKPFDFIYARCMEGSFADPEKIIEQAYKYG